LRRRRARLGKVRGIDATLDALRRAVPSTRDEVRAWEAGRLEPDHGRLEQWERWLTMLERRAAEQRTQAPPSEHKQVQAEFLRLWAEHNNGEPHSWGAREGKQTKELLQTYGVTGAMLRVRNLFASVGSYQVQASNLTTMGALVRLANQLAQPLPKDRKDAAPAPESYRRVRHL